MLESKPSNRMTVAPPATRRTRKARPKSTLARGITPVRVKVAARLVTTAAKAKTHAKARVDAQPMDPNRRKSKSNLNPEGSGLNITAHFLGNRSEERRVGKE